MNESDNVRSAAVPKLGGSFTFHGTSMTVRRIGYGAMQLAGPGVFGPPPCDCDAAVALSAESDLARRA